MKYYVGVKQVHRQYIVIEAENPSEAASKVINGEGNYFGDPVYESESKTGFVILTEDNLPEKVKAYKYDI
jgi:hypothetical protein